MSFLVTSCFDWVGFHMVNQLLEKGHEVDGVDEETTDFKEHLSMFLGRNSAFRLKTRDELTSYDTAIVIGEDPCTDVLKARKMMNISCNKIQAKRKASMTTIHVPVLFGEWMPMNERGMYMGNQFISFDSAHFLSEAVYIKDFINGLFQWMQADDLPSSLEVKSKSSESRAVKLENTVYIRDNERTPDKLKKVLNHYRSYQQFYA